MPELKKYCRQCDTRVSVSDANRCAWRFCKAKQNWPITSGRYTSPALLASVSNSPVEICEIIFAVAGDDQAVVAEIRLDSQVERLLRMRQAIIWTAKARGYSFHKIARAINRDHSTVMHAWRIARGLIETDAAFRARCEALAIDEAAA